MKTAFPGERWEAHSTQEKTFHECPDAEAAAGAPCAEALRSVKAPGLLRLAAAAPAHRFVASGSDAAAGDPKLSAHFGRKPNLSVGPVVAPKDGQRTNPRNWDDGELGERAGRLLHHLEEFTGLRSTSGSLPVDFKLTLQVVEYLGQQANLLHEVKIHQLQQMDQIANMHADLRASIVSLKESDDDMHVKRHQELSSAVRQVRGHVMENHETLHAKLITMHENLDNHIDTAAETLTKTDFPGGFAQKGDRSKKQTSRKIKNGKQDALRQDEQRGSPLTEANKLRERTDEAVVALTAGWVDQESPSQAPELKAQPGYMHRLLCGCMGPICGAFGGAVGLFFLFFSHCLQKFSRMVNKLDLWLGQASETDIFRIIISDPIFEWICAGVIMTNAITIGMMAEDSIQWAVAHPGTAFTDKNPVIDVMNKIYIAFYTSELLCKLWVWRLEFFLGQNWRWNMFDFVLVLSGLYDLLTEFAPVNMGEGVGVTWLRVLRILKTMKLLRVIRVMRFFAVLRRMVSSIVGSMMCLLWSIVMISIMMYMFGLCFLNAITGYLTDNKLETIPSSAMEGIDNYWSSVPQAMMTLFWAVTGGADWEPLAAPIREADNFFFVLFFFYIAFAAFAVLNVLTGMFVDTAMQVAQQDEENVVEELMNRPEVKVFRKHVLEQVCERKGFLTFDLLGVDPMPEVARMTPTMHVVDHFQKALEIEHADCARVFSMMDPDATGFVNLEDFIKGCCHAKGSISGLDMVLLMNETKHVNKQLGLAMLFLEERLDEMLCVTADGCETEIEPWCERLNNEKMNEAAHIVPDG